MSELYFMGELPEVQAYDPEMLRNMKDKERRDHLIVNNLRLVVYIAKKFNRPDEEDLVSVGTMGLIKAADRFEIEREIKFATYAARCIQNEILMYLRRNKKQEACLSLEEPIATDSNGKAFMVEDLVSTEETATTRVEEEADAEDLLELVHMLPEREQEIICLRYGIGSQALNQTEIGKRFNLSQSYVSRIEKEALKQMNQEMNRREKVCIRR